MIAAPLTAQDVAAFLAKQTAPLHIAYDDSVRTDVDTLSLKYLCNVVAYEPEEMIVMAEAGIPLADLETLLASRGQWIPTLVAAENPETTLGAAIVNDHYHPRAASLGMLRTAILGGSFCTTDGTLFKSGSRVVKSVAGYDIHRAFCGSRGRFGAIISVTLKVQPKPERFVRFKAAASSQTAIVAHSPTVLARLGDELIVELAGYAEDIAQSVTDLTNVIVSPLDVEQWLDVLAEIRSSHPTPTPSADVMSMLENVRAVFDPKHILV